MSGNNSKALWHFWGFVNAQGFDLLKLIFIFCGYVDVGGRGGGAKSHKFFSFIGGFIDVWKQQPISHFYCMIMCYVNV